MILFNFNPQAMTDQELLEKTTEIHKRLAYAQRFSLDGYLVEQLRSMADACAFEANERASTRLFEALNKNKPDEKVLTVDSTSKKEVSKTNGKVDNNTVKKESGFRIARTQSPSKE